MNSKILAKRILRISNIFFNLFGYEIYINKKNNKSGYQLHIGHSDKKRYKIARKVFDNRLLLWSDDGYWKVDPMPSEKELNFYYKNSYWQYRGGKKEGVTKRDIVHYIMLHDLASERIQRDVTFLNFGAGHGGISHLMRAEGLHIINIEPSPITIEYDDRWECYQNIQELKDNSIDIVYGSHSLEHVPDIAIFMETLRSKTKGNALHFWEVPNGMAKQQGAKRDLIDIPHTYYFTTSFFENMYKDILINKAFKAGIGGNLRDWKSNIQEDNTGKVIRFMGYR